MHRWCSLHVRKIPKYTSTFKTKISLVRFDTLHDPQRGFDFERSEFWSEYCVNYSCNPSKLHKNENPEIENLFRTL